MAIQDAAQTPAPKKTKVKSSSGSGETHPAVDLFVGYSFVRFCTNSFVTSTTTSKKHSTGTALPALWPATSIAGSVWWATSARIASRTCLPPSPAALIHIYLVRNFRIAVSVGLPSCMLFGAATLADVQVSTTPSPSAFFNRSFSANSFATALDGGVDRKFQQAHWRTRFQAEYLITRFTDGNNNKQNNLRAAARLVVRFGGNRLRRRPTMRPRSLLPPIRPKFLLGLTIPSFSGPGR